MPRSYAEAMYFEELERQRRQMEADRRAAQVAALEEQERNDQLQREWANHQKKYNQMANSSAAKAAGDMVANAPSAVNQRIMQNALPYVKQQQPDLLDTFQQASQIDPNTNTSAADRYMQMRGMSAEQQPIAQVRPYTSALDQAQLIADNLFKANKNTDKPKQSALQVTNVPDGGSKVPNYAMKVPEKDTRTATEKELGKANTTVNGLSEDAQRDLTKIIGMQADYDVMAKTAPAYGAMLDYASLQRREDAKKALDAAEAKFKKDYGVSDEEYLKLKDYRQRITNAEYNQNQQKEMQQSFNTGNALKDYANIGLYTVGSTLNYPVRGGEALLDIVAQGKNKDSDLGVDIYGKGFNQTNLTNNIRQAAAERIGNGVLGETGSNLYQTGASIADSIYGGALAGAVVPQLEVGNKVANWFANKGVQALGMAPTIGASAAATAYQDARNRGLDEKHAEATAITSGLIEVATESFSLDNLFDVAKGSSRLLRKPLIQLLASSGIEGSEEWASEGLNAVADWLINKGQSEYEQAVSAYKESGMSDADARQQAKMDVLHDANDAAKWGAIAGFVPGAATTVIGTNQITKQARQIYGGENMDYEALGKSIVTDESRYENKSAAKSAQKAYDLTQKLDQQQKNGREASDRDLRNLYWNLQDAAVTETEARNGDESRVNPSVEVYDALPEIVTRKMEEDKIKQYNAADKDLTAEDVTKKMAKASTAQELVSIRKQAENSEYENVRKAAQDAFEMNQGRIMSQNEEQTAEAFEAAEAMPTTKEAFNAGLENGTLDQNASREAQIAFREGRMISIARASRQNVSEDFKGAAVSENNESALTGEIKLTGKEMKAVTDNGTVSLDEIADPAVKALYRNAADQGTEAAAQVYLDNYATNMPIGRYTNAFDRYSVAGATNTMQFEEMYKNDTLLHKWMTKDQLKAIYDFGAQEASAQKLENAQRQNDAIAVRGTGRVVDLTKSGTDKSLLNMIGAMAKATQKDYVITDQAAQNINGYFNRSMQRVVLNAKNSDMLMNTLFHEGFGEVLKAHNAEGYHKVQQSIMDYLSESPSGFQSSIKNYQAAYKDVEGKKALYDAASEMINDSIAGLFSTEEGIKDFSKWADSKYSQQEKKTLFQNIADYFQKLVDSFHDMLDRSRLSDPARRAARMGAKRAAEIRQMILAEMDIAAVNAEGLEVDESLKNEDDISYSITQDRNDEYDGGIRYSIDTTAEALNLTFEKEGNLTVLRDQDGKKITRMTPSMVRNTPLGGMINSGIKNGFISEQNAKDEYQFVSDLVNQMLKTQDLDMVFAVNSVLGFQELQSGARPDWTKNPMKSKNAGYVSNSDPQYSSTVDFTTICVKSQAIIDVMSATMKKLGRGLTSDEITKIVYKNTHEAGEPVPCPVCYVFSRWVGLGGLFDNMKNLQEKYADADVKQIRADMADLDKQIADTQQKLDGSKKTKGKAKEKLYKELKEEYDKLHKVINAEKLGGKVLLSKEQRSRHDLLEKQIGLLDDWTWLQKVRLSKNYKPVPLDVLFDINAGSRFANEYPEAWTYRTTRGPAMGKAATPYADEHLGQIVRGISSPSSLKNLGDLVKDPFLFSKKKGEPVETVVGGQLSANASRMITNAIKKARVQNLLNGQRMQSTSDFRFEYALDYLLGLYELQSVGAKVQMYTKVPESVGFLASAGAEINLSMMPFENGYEMDEDGDPVYDENGNLKLLFSDVTGMHPDDAFRLSSMYDNVQPIVVGTNNIFIRGLLADPRITFIIPYHASGSNEGRYVDMMRAVGESVKSRQDYSAYQTDTENKDATPAQKAAYDLRTDIVTGKAKKLSAAEKAILADNPVLHQLYQRFYGVDVNGNTARIENKYLDSADRGANGYGTVDHNTLNTFLTASQAKTIMPYEFWDKTLTIDQADRNGDAFRSYCESLGLHPRFTGWTDKGKYEAEQDFSKDSGYWKMLPDRAMYNRDGTYHEQQAINVSNMRLDYLDRAKTVEGITKPSVENDRNKVEMIAQKTVEDINNGVKYSLSVDTEGRELSKGQQDFFKDSKIRDENGALKVMYHGTARMDRVGNIFDPKRATSGPMAYFTDNRSVAENYAKDKDDTSKAYDERYDSYHTQFRTTINGQEMSVDDAWNKLPAAKKNEIKNKAEHITMDDDWENIIYDSKHKGGLGNFDSYLIRENGGNYIKALVSSWLDDGNLYGEESRFLEVLRFAGITDVEYMDPNFRDEGVYEVYLNITNPLNTSDIPESIITALRDASKTAVQGDSKGADFWDKNSISPALWIERLNDGLENDSTNVWTSIPDWVTDVLKENGYDGIVDQGGKYHPLQHQVVIPFSSEQIKKVDNQNPTKNIDIRYSLGNDFVDFTEMDMFQPDANGEFAEEEMASILTEGAEALRNTPIDKGVIDKIAKKMTKFYGSSYSAQDLSDNLEKVFSYAAEYDIDNAKDLARIVKEVAMPVIETAERKTGGEELKAAKKALSGFKLDLTDRQRQEVMRAFGSYVNYKRAMKKLGVTIAANGSSMDGMWTSLADTLPGTLPVDAVEGDMPLILYDQLSGLGSRIDNGFGMDNEEAAQDLALKIMSEYYSEMGKQEGLKKADREILKAQAQKSKETMSEYRLRLQNEYDARYNAEYADLKKRFDDKTAKKLADIQAKSKARAQKSRDAADARYQKDQIRKSAEKLLNMLYHPNKKKHVPAQLQDTVIDLLSALDFVGPKIERLPDGRYQTKIPVPGVNGQKHFETYTGDSYMEVMNKYQEAFRNGQGTKSYQDWKTKLSAVTKLYSESKTAVATGDNVSDFQMLLKADLGEALERVIEENNGRTSVNSLGSEDLKVLNKVIKNIYTAISNIDKSYSMPEEVSEIGNSVIERGAKMKSKGDRLKASKLISRFMRMDNATPETFFHGMGAAGDKIYKALFEAQNQKARFEREDRKFMDTIFERVPVKTIQSWTDNNSPVIYEDGDFKLRVDQVMTLYEIAKRQSTQAHMYEGFKAGTVSVGKLGLKEHVDEKAHILTKAKINEITSHLTQDQKWVADQLQQYMATVGSKRGNDQTLKIYGYEMFTEPDYFPAQVDQTTVQTNAKNASTEGNVNGVLNAGFTNEIKPKATNTLILNSIFDVYLNHMNEINTYASHAGILTDINRINNYKVKEDVTVEKQKFGVTHTVKQALDNIYGQEGKSYLVQFLKDINQQEMATKTGAGVLAALTKNFKSAATLGNLRVVGQQPTAWCRALILIDPKYMAEGLAPNKAAAKLQEETSMISWIKDNGNISGLTTQSQRAQVLGLQTRKEKINELTGWLAGKADSVTWAALYRAVYAEQKDKFDGKTDSEEFKKAVNDRFDEVIARTQVVDGTLMRSQMMRSGDRMNMNFSAFMAEPTKTYNMFLRQFNDMTYEKRMTGKIPRKAWETMSRIIAAHIITQLVNAIPQSIMDAARDEDDETTYAEKFLANLGINVDDDASALEKAFTAVEGNFVSNLGVIGKLPVLSTINDNYVWPWIEKLVWGEDAYTSGVTNNDFQALNAIDLALKGTVFKSEKSKLTTYGSAARIVNAISMALGVPVYGLMRDTVAAYNTFNDLWGGENIRRTAPTSAQLVKPVFNSIDTGSDYKAAIEKAVEKGSDYEKIETNITKQYKQQYIDLMREGKTDEAAKLENRLMMIYDYLNEKEGQKPSNKNRVKKFYTDWQKENGVEQIELTGGSENSGSRMINMTNVESMDVPVSEEPANIWGNAYVTRQPRSTSYWTSGSSDWEKEHHTNAARMIQEAFAHGYDPNQPYENDFRRNSEWHMKQINKKHYARKKTYGSGGGNAVAWKSQD